jgi:hypothetical protein
LLPDRREGRTTRYGIDARDGVGGKSGRQSFGTWVVVAQGLLRKFKTGGKKRERDATSGANPVQI